MDQADQAESQAFDGKLHRCTSRTRMWIDSLLPVPPATYSEEEPAEAADAPQLRDVVDGTKHCSDHFDSETLEQTYNDLHLPCSTNVVALLRVFLHPGISAADLLFLKARESTCEENRSRAVKEMVASKSGYAHKYTNVLS